MSRLVRCSACHELADGWLTMDTGEEVPFCVQCANDLHEPVEPTEVTP